MTVEQPPSNTVVKKKTAYIDHGWMDTLADFPWGVLAFLLILGLTAVGIIGGADARGLATAAGLLGIGHGIHTGSKNLRR